MGGTSDYCREGLHGVYCSQCVGEGLYYSSLDLSCYSCEGFDGPRAFRLAVGVGVMLIVLRLLCSPLQRRLSALSKQRKGQLASRLVDASNEMRGFLKIIFSFYQVAASVSDVYTR